MLSQLSFLIAVSVLCAAFVSARPVRADSIELAGDVLQFAIPAVALGMTGYRRDLAGAGYLTASALVTEGIVWTLKVTIDSKRPSGGGEGFPSGHSATAALGAGFMHRRYGLRYAVPLYLGTGFVAWSRYDAGAHRTVDLVGGIAIGIATPYLITRPWAESVVVVPMAVDGGFGAVIAGRF